ncbi:MFS transporter [Nakamurella leprariae]|uniref:MFS transporter n=1 Tax=Nakamurella leprariae TaxID=2803911 RepID=A0A938YAX0_9ACTN|nr:MFS transporter [Nakamurella leprariae]MBM9466236.1 MFS transporter [Nakamurella leprariae]
MGARGQQTGRGAARLTLLAMTLANGMILVDQTAVPLALPDIMGTFRVQSSTVQWVLTASLLPLAGLLVLGGRLGDLLGRRRIFLLGSVLFAGASAVAGLAPTFPILLVARVVQGAGGALMLPATVAIVRGAFPRSDAGRALGLMGGIAAVAGALGPTIGGGLTSSLGWRSVLLINLPLLAVTLVLTLRAVPADQARSGRVHVDLAGTVLLCLTLIGLVLGLSSSSGDGGFASPAVLVPLAVAVASGIGFVVRERRCHDPLMDFGLLRRHRNYLGATLSQGLGGVVEMGLGIIFPLLLILNLEMDPGLAGLALIPTTLPMIILAPLAGRWYDAVGGRVPLVTGFLLLAVSGVALALAVHANEFLPMLPGLLLYGSGLAIVLTVNDPVSLDTVPDRDSGQASGVSATAEQGGGAIGIALLYAVFHTTYLAKLDDEVAARGLPALDDVTGTALRDQLVAEEATGLRPEDFDATLSVYLGASRRASDFGYGAAFLVVTVVGVIGAAVSWWLVRKPPADPADQIDDQIDEDPSSGRQSEPSGP